MIVTKAGYEILEENLAGAKNRIYFMIEDAGRTCYRSEDKKRMGSAGKFVAALVRNGHEAMLEHASLSVRFTIDRGVSHEAVRHREASFAQESSRYCNYSNEKFGGQISVIRPFYLDDHGLDVLEVWTKTNLAAEEGYMKLLELGLTPEEARCVLPTDLRTELVVTCNMREWRHILKLRAAGYTGRPHPQIAEVMIPLLFELQEAMPELFGDIEIQPCVLNTVWGQELVRKAKEKKHDGTGV